MNDWILFVIFLVIYVGVLALLAFTDGTVYTSTTTETHRHVPLGSLKDEDSP